MTTVHRLLVRAEPDDENGALTLFHDPDCPRIDDGWLACAEHAWDVDAGLNTFFLHSLDAGYPRTAYAEVLEPGLYEVEAWSEKVRDDTPMGPAEWTGGMRVVETPREPYPGDWEGLEPAESHQLWVWLQGATPPHWEIRGTGALLDEETEREFRERRARTLEEYERESGLRDA